jgi:class 3 adenylate cyclase/predicted ATPase
VDFDELLKQVLALVQRQGRVSYRAITRRFNVDEAYLTDLREEILFAYPHICDEEGRGLVWANPPAPTAGSPLPDISSPQVASPSVGSHSSDAERRQLTVLFCDLVDSTMLAGRLDPEDLREVVRAYQATCAEIIQHFDGHIAQYLGDGLLVYFGYPQAHEDDAQRAVRTGLGMLDALGGLNAHLAQQYHVRVAVRIGIHTGVVVVGEMGGGGRHEQLALGEAPNVASRLQGLAPPDTVLISAATHRLVQGYFTVEDRGIHPLKGVSAPMPIYGVRGESLAEGRFEAATATGLTPLVGRNEEIGLLLRRWKQAKEGEGQVVLLVGEAGIGKSRIVQTVREHLADEPHIPLRCQCLPYYTNSAFYPFIAHLERAMGCEQDAAPAVKLNALEVLLDQMGRPGEDVVPLFASLLSIPSDDRYPPLTFSPQQQKTKTIEALINQVRALSQHRPVLYIFEDVHWLDPTSLEVVDSMIARVQDTRVLLVMTYRPEFTPPWSGFTHVTTHTINRLDRQQVAILAERVTRGKALPQVVLDHLIAKTDGMPLFVEELTKTVLEAGWLTDDGECYKLTGPLPLLAIPDTLQGSLMARLDHLAPVKETAQLGAAIGREFTYELLAAVSSLPDIQLQETLHQLVQSGLIFRRGQSPEATYIFKHALIQDTAYQSLLKPTRQQYHQRIAQVLKTQFPDRVANQPELLAHHYTEAGLAGPAVDYWLRAGQHAVQSSAHQEAISHLRKGLELLGTLPDTPARVQQELDLQMLLGPAMMVTQGYGSAEVERVYTRARWLCQQVGDTPQRFPMLRGLWQFSILRTELRTAYELAKQFFSLAQQAHPACLPEAYRLLGEPLGWLGEFAAARTQLEQGLAIYASQPSRTHTLFDEIGLNPQVTCAIFAALALWALGYPDQAQQQVQAALTTAQALPDPVNRAFALCFAALLHQLRRDAAAMQAWAKTAVALSTEQGFAHFLALGTIYQGWALARQDQAGEGLAHIRQGLAAYEVTGATLERPYSLALLAEGYRQVGEIEAGLTALDEALTLVDEYGARWCEAELQRLKGELLLVRPTAQHAAAEACFQRALAVAHRQDAKSWELRAAMSLGRLWQQQGKRAEAHALLAPVYGWFTEGFDTADLQDAKTLLDVLV